MCYPVKYTFLFKYKYIFPNISVNLQRRHPDHLDDFENLRKNRAVKRKSTQDGSVKKSMMQTTLRLTTSAGPALKQEAAENF